MDRVLGRFTTTRMFRFGVIGVSGVAVNLAILQCLIAGLHWRPEIASGLAVEASIINNFLWNNRWTFEQHHISLARFGKYNLVALGGLVITSVIFAVLLNHAGFHYLLAQLIGIGAAMAWNFCASVLWAWGV